MKKYLSTVVTLILLLAATTRASATLAIYGPTSTIIGETITLNVDSSMYWGGTWTIGNHTVAAISPYGDGTIATVSGIAAGTTVVTYTHPTYGIAIQTIIISSFGVKFYWDIDSDCTRSPVEPLSTLPILVGVDSNGISIDTITATTGIFCRQKGPAGTIYGYRVISPAAYGSCVSVVYDTVQVPAVTHFKEYALRVMPGADADLTVHTAIPVTGAHDQWGYIYVHNNMPLPIAGSLTLNTSPKYGGFRQSNPSATVSGNTLNWPLAALSPIGGTLTFYFVSFSGATGPAIHDTVINGVIAVSSMGDIDLSNNTVVHSDTVRAGCDPNFIEVSPSPCYANDTTLHYVVHFENTGNDTAHNIYILDTLSYYLDESTLRIEEASAPMFVSQFRYGSRAVLKFDFPNINLLDSSHHGLCDGAVFYSVKPKSSLGDGSIISGRAGIYFDYNDVVLTNTASVTKGCPILSAPTTALGASHLEIAPNPTTNILNVAAPQDIESLNITNSVGKTVFTAQSKCKSTSIDLSTFPAGLYILKATYADGEVAMQKFVKQ